MRRKTRWMALFMAAAMMMTGCGSSGSTESTDASADTASAAESVSTDTASAGGKVVTMARDLDSSNLDPVMTADFADPESKASARSRGDIALQFDLVSQEYLYYNNC